MNEAERYYKVFERATLHYHEADSIDASHVNPYEDGTFDHVLFEKNWIDAVQWHMEDVIRDPAIDPVEALALKRRIDRSNQDRTDIVEAIDSRFRDMYARVEVEPGATINTESPAWALDRLSILALKIYHMRQEVERGNVSEEHVGRCRARLEVLTEQRDDLMAAIDTLLGDIACGRKYMKVYRQMKMYNDPDTNPVLYATR